MSATMGSVEAPSQRPALPPITHLDLDKVKMDRPDSSRFPAMHGLQVSTAPLGSPSSAYSGAPPPPYSYAASTTNSTACLPGYISPPESTTRRSTRDEKDSPSGRTSLPSIHEALGDKTLSFATPLSVTAPHFSGSTPSTAIPRDFPEPVKGSSHPLSQHPTFRDNPFSTQSQPVPPPPPPDQHQPKSNLGSVPPPETRPPQPPSPRSAGPSTFRPPFPTPSDSAPSRSPLHPDKPHQSYSFPPFPSVPAHGHTTEPYHFSSGSKYQDQRPPLSRPPDLSYGDTVKRHLDVFDAELGLNEIADASGRTHEFSRTWAQRYHQGNRNGYYQDSLPSVHEIDDMMRYSHRVLDNLNRMREVVAQQSALSEQRARMARNNHMDDEYNGISDEYKGGGFAGGDAKKRRGKAAPPGRCHSCNRAETPEWRRGPDGARTLCNACGLHYAKLTRKMGMTKASGLTGSNLRPKS